MPVWGWAVAAVTVLSAAVACSNGGEATRPTTTASVVPDSVLAVVTDENMQAVDAESFRLKGLSAIAARGTCATGRCMRVFFFYDGAFVGTDTRDVSAQVSVQWLTSDTVALLYVLYRPEDIECCPTGGAATVRFRYDRGLAAVDPVPPPRLDDPPLGR